MADKIKPWQRQPQESSPAFEAFVVYRDLMGERSTRQASELLKKSKSVIDDWSRKHKWVERCHQWDNEVDRRTSNGQVAEIRSMKRRQIKMAYEMQSVAQMALESLSEKLQMKQTKKTLVTPDQIARLADTGARLERLNHEEPSSITQVQKMDFSGLSVEEMFQLRALLVKCGSTHP